MDSIKNESFDYTFLKETVVRNELTTRTHRPKGPLLTVALPCSFLGLFADWDRCYIPSLKSTSAKKGESRQDRPQVGWFRPDRRVNTNRLHGHSFIFPRQKLVHQTRLTVLLLRT